MNQQIKTEVENFMEDVATLSAQYEIKNGFDDGQQAGAEALYAVKKAIAVARDHNNAAVRGDVEKCLYGLVEFFNFNQGYGKVERNARGLMYNGPVVSSNEFVAKIAAAKNQYQRRDP